MTDEICADCETDTTFECFSRFADYLWGDVKIICHVSTVELYLNETPIHFAVRYGDDFRVCSVESQLEHECSVRNTAIYGSVEVCLVLTEQQYKCCQNLKLTEIIKPEAPFGLNVIYQEKEDAYLVQFSIPLSSQTYLKDCLLYEIAYRPDNNNWTMNNNTKEFQRVPVTLLRKEFQPSTKYELRVRSKPSRDYFKGSWSEWSHSVYLQTAQRSPEETDDQLILMTASIVGFFVLMILIFLILVFWKNRIKPVVWPAIPNHEKTLDKLCNTLRKNSEISFFNPESLGYAHIHKVDGIQAKSETEHLQQLLLPWAVDVSEMVGSGSELKNNLSHINHGWLKLSLAYEGMWPAERLNRHLGRSSHINSDEFTHANLYNKSGTGGQRGCSDALNAHSSALLDPNIPPGLDSCQADLSHQAYANSEVRVSNKEEAYVSMASFFESKGNLGN
ncbi:interleukin-7 receptor subunit alpha [Eublepharis macularius]|uniref:Interleukin-7 receptor subunit alpha n=1 Tax=Eublepharis macularius TaxID=481883 RepID=A0AA97L7M5_EUBMA|nr:interleukin-7 receptor subunit alpha [Eublepharis macularius]